MSHLLVTESHLVIPERAGSGEIPCFGILALEPFAAGRAGYPACTVPVADTHAPQDGIIQGRFQSVLVLAYISSEDL
ncbi:hypothetical protein Barb4_02169 [Bacteroidales bacterium Barb4]|nr:hypothetical protein Barb4_02169 [Bacteroidales bacterium Barb4]